MDCRISSLPNRCGVCRATAVRDGAAKKENPALFQGRVSELSYQDSNLE